MENLRNNNSMTEEEDDPGSALSFDSTESRWVFQEDEDPSEIEDYDASDMRHQSMFDSEDEDNAEMKLIRTGPRIDSFDVEALEVPGAHTHHYEDMTTGKKIVLAFQTLGVVFGDVGTSPLYTFSVMFRKAPINDNEDILGALSLVLYTLILIPFLKYVLVVLWANDDGEGGTFALYSLICRNAKVNLLPNQLPSDARISGFRLKVPSAELERSLKLKERLESSFTLKKILLLLVLAGTSMVIANGVVTPAMSVLSSVNGLKVGVDAIQQDEVVMISVACLVVLFSLQKYGTSKVGLAVGPALFIWFCSLAGNGVYNLVKYDSSVFRAFNPIHIYYFFARNSTKAWYSLGGCLLCATGSEAMFADLCYFSVRSVQITFLFLVLPCLLLGYLGQAAYLMEHHADAGEAFFSSVPSGAFWPTFLIANIAALIASRTMTTATFSCIKQSTALGCFPRLKIIHTSRKFMGQIYIPVINWFLLAVSLVFVCTISSIDEIGNAYGIAELGVMMMTTILVTLVMLLIWQMHIIIVMSFLGVFLGLELVFFSSVLWSITDGSWIILVFAAIMFFIMFIWNYGSKLKYETEVKQKLSPDLMRELGCNLGTIRAPGIGLLYNELVKGIPGIFGHFLTTLPAIHSMIIFVSIKYVPVAMVPQSERFLFRRVCQRSYHLFRCIARYGYKDARKENHQAFEQLLMESLEKFIRREAQERSLESDGDEDTELEDEYAGSRVLIAPNGSVYSLGVPLLADFNESFMPSFEPSTSEEAGPPSPKPLVLDAEQLLERELSFIRNAKESGLVYLLGHGDIRARKDSWFIKKLVINYFYAFLRKNCRRGVTNLSVPHSHLMQVGMTYMV
ncbi:putative potassium transporter [Medicago truncatula]|uniref:Potassium transporter n=1 Tax=Medicago truncatula TaxID=3880 RepID=G7KE77_MEDTR|nr:potassium transporter 7 [Medicago truncatula]AES98621.2 potassium transporter-like protein [Medicago truncatula]RHN56485.1 putative potassium transporter [Medicago truncatula]